MAYLSAYNFALTEDTFLDAMTQGSVWSVGQERIIDWAIADGFANEIWSNPQTTVQKIFELLTLIETFSGIGFHFNGYYADPIQAGDGGADIVFSLFSDELLGGQTDWAYTFSPTENHIDIGDLPGWDSQGGDIFLNVEHSLGIDGSLALGTPSYALLLNEVLYALGVQSESTYREKHPDGDRPLISDLGFGGDGQTISALNFNDDFPIEDHFWIPATPMPGDILALQVLYGTNAIINNGNTTYGILEHSNELALSTRHGDLTIDLFYFHVEQDIFFSLWDSGGTDLIDLSNVSSGWVVELPDTELTEFLDIKFAGGAYSVSAFTEENSDNTLPYNIYQLVGDFENVIGGNFDDDLSGNSLNNWLHGNGGNDVLSGGGGNDTLEGGDGIDTAQYFGSQTGYTLTLSPEAMVLSDRSSSAADNDPNADGLNAASGTDHLVDIELIQFSDSLFGAHFNLDKFAGLSGVSGAELESFIELYIAYFNRAPDAVGLNFWGTAFATGTTLDEMAALFVDQIETRLTYPSGTSNEDFAQAVYQNVLGRAPDQAGIDFWVGLLDAEKVGRDQFILNVLQGAKSDLKHEFGQAFVDQQLADRAYLEIKTDIGAYFAVHKGMSNVPNASAAMAHFDGTPASTMDAVSAIDAFYADAVHHETGEFLMPIVGVLEVPDFL